MEDSTKCEDTELNSTTPMSSQVNQQIFPDIKSLVDNKNTQVRVIRGTKKFKIDNDLGNVEKKGVLTYNLRNKYFNYQYIKISNITKLVISFNCRWERRRNGRS